ncbi:STAS domain-containing protein [Planococcus sp. 1R117A]|uniref:STAS domain-containing protein n=1 Tax=Planococcus sp. 1R117A TaxID=3447020 RepID=UPI003EDCAC0C
MTMKSQFNGLPLPALKVDNELSVIDYSIEALDLFGECHNFTDIVDEGSLQKALNLLSSDFLQQTFELNFISKKGDLLLADVYGKRNNPMGFSLVIVPKDNQLQHISDQLSKLRERLRETDYDLFQEKERTLELLQKVRELSAPCIHLDRNRLLVPLFGDLTEEQVLAFTPRLLANIYENQAETIIFDLTALGKIMDEGLQYLDALLQSLSIMGTSSVFTGVKPEHAKRLYRIRTKQPMCFAASLQDVLSSDKWPSKS